MSNAAVCPECKVRPVPAEHYLCEKCEGALVASTTEEPRRPKPARPRFRFPRFEMPRRAAPTERPQAVEVDDKPVKPADMRRLAFLGRERPRWMQYAFFLALVTLGTGAAWGARIAADHHTANGRVAVVKGYLHGISDSWRKLFDALQ
jgi:hypothetical protein